MIIMITGKAGCGKDTAYRIMEKYASNSIRRFAFADYLKEIAYMAGWDGNKDDKGRQLLVSLGKTINQYHKNFFVHRVADAIMSPKHYQTNTKVITDLRLPCEYQAMKQWVHTGEKIITIKIFGRASEYGRTTNDITEQDISEDDIGRCFDFIIDNSGSYSEFENNIKYIVKELDI